MKDTVHCAQISIKRGIYYDNLNDLLFEIIYLRKYIAVVLDFLENRDILDYPDPNKYFEECTLTLFDFEGIFC